MVFNRMFKRVLTIIKKDTLRLIVLVISACTVAVVYNQMGPTSLDWIRVIEPAEEQQVSLSQVLFHIQNQSALFIDARSASDYARGHIADAYNISSREKEFYFSEIKRILKNAPLIILYCTSSHCKQGELVYRYLITQGISAKKIRLYPGGWEVLGKQDAIPKHRGKQP